MKLNVSKYLWTRTAATAVTIAIVALVVAHRATDVQQIPEGWAADNVKPIAYSDLDGRGGAFKMTIREVNGRWYLYMGHLWHSGWSIVDVTDPTVPTVVKFVPGPPYTRTINITASGDTMITSLDRLSEAWGGDPTKQHQEGALIWDISDPANPKQLSHWKTGSTGTHRNGYPGGRYAHMAADQPGFEGHIYIILDISDPKNPKEAGRWWMPGQKEGEPPPSSPISFHGPAMIDGNTAYLGYGPAVVILDISDVSKPKLIGQLKISPPFKPGGTAVHGVLPIPGKSLLFANSEAGNEMCDEPLNQATLIDIKDPTNPRLLSLFPLPVPPEGLPYTDFCDKGGRFGPHNTNHEQHQPDVQKQGDLIYLTYFNAGLRIYDIRNPRMPKEVGWFVAPTPLKRIAPIPQTRLVTQTEDVLVDRRGNIYITDKQWGLFVLRYTGSTAATPSN